jgi:hypothetical protein
MIIQEHNGPEVQKGKSFFDNPENMVGDVVDNTQRQRTPNDILKEIYSAEPPQPTYDPNRPEEIKRIGRVNAIGEGLKVLGDFVSLGTGANVNRREPDRTTPNMLSALWQNIDKVSAQKDNWNYQNYLNKIRNAQTELGQVNHDNDVASANARYRDGIIRQEARDVKNYENESKIRAEDRQGRIDLEKLRAENDLKKLKEDLKGQSGLIAQRTAGEISILEKRIASGLSSSGGYGTSSKDKFKLYDAGKNVVGELDKGELEYLAGLIANDDGIFKSGYNKTIMHIRKGEPVSDNELELLVQSKWNKLKNANGLFKTPAKSTLSPQGQVEQNQEVQKTVQKLGNIYNLDAPKQANPAIYKF